MKKLHIILTLVCFVSLTSFSATPQPTSEIPAKREFPPNPEVNPCDNFHDYVCSIAESNFKLRDDRSRHTFAFSDSDERLLEAKKSFMKNLPREKGLTSRGQQIKNFYMSCMDTKSRVKEEIKKLAEVQDDLKKIKSAKSFVQYLNAQSKRGNKNFSSFWISPNLDDPLKLNFQISVSLMDLPDHSYYENKELMKSYQSVLAEFFKTVEPTLTEEQALTKSARQVQLQNDFIKIYPVKSVRRQRYSEKRTSSQEDAAKKYDNLSFNQIFEQVPGMVLINTTVPESIEFLNSSMNDEMLDTLKDYYLYRVASSFMDEAFPQFFKTQFDFEKNYFGGPQVRPDLQERCTTKVADTFQMELDQILIGRLFPGFKDEKVRVLATKIRGSIIAGLEKNSWLTPEAKAEAKRKIQNAKLQLVRPQNNREWDFLPVQKYSTNRYLENERIYALASYNKQMEDLKHPANQEAWGMGPLTVNAYYSQSENKFVLPIGILQFPFYNKDSDLIENLGAVGAVFGHELGHSIDDQGSKYNADGKLSDWMTMKDKAEFSKRGQKMIDQFNKIGHDGMLTQGENIADLVGLTFAYQAAFPEGKGSIEDKKRFFTGYGRLWCTVSRPDYEKRLLKTDPHAAGWARINEQVKHQSAFSEAFNCKAGSKMTLPEKDRVQIW